MTQRRTGRPQISVSLRFPPEVLDHLDALVALRNERELAKPESERQHIFRADVISGLLAPHAARSWAGKPVDPLKHLPSR